MKYQRLITEIKNYVSACQYDGEPLLDIDLLGIIQKHIANAQPYEAKGEEGGDYIYPSFPSDIDQVMMSAASAIANLRTIVGKRSRRRELIAVNECEKILKYADIINKKLRFHPAPVDRTEELVGPDKWVGKSSSKPCFCLGPDKCSDNTCEIRRRYLECVADYEKGAK